MSKQEPPMGAVTGGSVAGKTSMMPFLAEALPRYGIKPFFIPEVATDLFSGGIDVVETENLQELIMQRMLSDQDIFKKAARAYSGNLRPLILCDRGIPDCIPYSKPGEFEANAKKFGTTLHQLRDEYDFVIHLVSIACDKPDIFAKVFKNNPHRREGKNDQGEFSIERACQEIVKGDQAIKNAYLGTPKFKVIPNRSTFHQKKRAALKAILSAMGIPLPKEIEFKYLVPKFFSLDDIPVPTETIHLTQYYLDKTPQRDCMNYPQNASKIIERVRIREHAKSRTYIYTLKAFVPRCRDPYEMETFMSEREFNQLVVYANSAPIRKKRTYFIHENQYFEFDQFEKPIDKDANNILELEVSSKNTRPVLPSFIPNLIEVTGKDYYRNENIAKRLVAV